MTECVARLVLSLLCVCVHTWFVLQGIMSTRTYVCLCVSKLWSRQVKDKQLNWFNYNLIEGNCCYIIHHFEEFILLNKQDVSTLTILSHYSKALSTAGGDNDILIALQQMTRLISPEANDSGCHCHCPYHSWLISRPSIFISQNF